MSDSKSIEQAARALLAEGLYTDVEQLVRPALESDADQGALWLIRGLASHRARDFGLARRSLEEASVLVPLAAGAMLALAECYVETDAVAQAKAIYQQLAADPGVPASAYPTLSAGLGRIGETQAALDVCRKAAAADPDRPEPLLAMCFYLMRLGYPPRVALPLMTKAFDLAPGSALYRCALAFLLADDNQNEVAYELLRELPATRLHCACQLRRMMAVFRAVGDFGRWQDCRDRLDSVSDPS